MSDYLLPLLMVSAATLAVAALTVVYLLPPDRAARRAPGVRWLPMSLSALLVGAATSAVGVLSGAAASTTTAAAVLLAASVALHAPLSRSWPVRGVTAWVLLTVAGITVLVSVAANLLASGMPWEALVASAVGAAVLVAALGRAHRRLRTRLGVRAGVRRAARVPVYLRPALLRPGMALGVFFAAFTLTGVTEQASPGEEGRRPGTDRAVRPSGPDGTVGPTRPTRLVSSLSKSSGQESGALDRRPAARPEATAGQMESGTGETADREGVGGMSVTSSAGAAGTDRPAPSGQPTSATPSRTPRTVSSQSGETGPGEESEQPVEEGPTGPLAPVTKPVEKTLGPVTTPVQEPAEELLEPVTAPVEDTVGQVTDAVGSALP